MIGTFTTEATGSASNWKNHFIGFNSTTDGIAKITLTGTQLIIDKLTFEKQQECLTIPTFGPLAITESFEGINGSGFVNSQPATPFTFGSGIELTGPSPNTGQVFIGDWSQGNAPRYFCDNFPKAFTATDVPDGTAYLSLMNTTSTLTFTLPAPSSKVGMYVEGLAGTCVSSTTITLTAYNASNAVIGSCTTAATSINDGSNWKNHFLGFRSLSDGIAKITISGPYIMIDKLTFEPLPCVPKTWYLDADNDGYYVGSGVESCTAPDAGYKTTGLTAGGDCNDADPNVLGPVTLYRDADHDSFGDSEYSISICSADDIPGGYIYVTDSSDCNDNLIMYADLDGDGYAGTTRVACGGLLDIGRDCNDNDVNIHEPRPYWYDNDGDGFGNPQSMTLECSLTPPDGYVNNASDFNDNQVIYADNDGDGFGAGSPVIMYGVTNNSDCDDTKPSVYPGAVEICGDGIDNNCDGQIDENCAVTYGLSIAEASMLEGNRGRSNMSFMVTLDKPSTKKITVQYKTQNVAATAGSDYAAKSGTLTFKPGVTKQNVAIPIIGDMSIEPNETFSLVLSNPVNAALSKGNGTGTILNDDVTLLTSTQAMNLKVVASEISVKLTVTVAPNPSHSYFTLHTQSGSDKPLQVRTVDALGRQIEIRRSVPANGTLMLGGNYRPGIYITEVLQGIERITLKLIKQSN